MRKCVCEGTCMWCICEGVILRMCMWMFVRCVCEGGCEGVLRVRLCEEVHVFVRVHVYEVHL